MHRTINKYVKVLLNIVLSSLRTSPKDRWCKGKEIRT